jgi:hypothetical protein
MKTPQLIVLTPVFNEAWILPAFLKATSSWADYIIVADQMSTDGCRDIYPQYDKVIVVDNPRKEMHQAATRRLLFEEAKKIEGDKILFTLDADEFLSGDFMHTKGWQTIMNSEPGDVFEFRWMNLSADVSKYSTWQHYYWAAHVDEELLNGQFPDNFIHEWRLPWPEHVNHEYKIDDISFVHFARVNTLRQRNKERFYQISQSAPMGKYSGIRFYRQYHPVLEETFYEVPMDAYACYEAYGIDIMESLNLQDEGKHYTDAVLRKIGERGIGYFKKLDVWEHGFLRNNNLQDPRTWWDKMMHTYLRATNKYQKTFLIRAIDKILKKIY